MQKDMPRTTLPQPVLSGDCCYPLIVQRQLVRPSLCELPVSRICPYPTPWYAHVTHGASDRFKIPMAQPSEQVGPSTG